MKKTAQENRCVGPMNRCKDPEPAARIAEETRIFTRFRPEDSASSCTPSCTNDGKSSVLPVSDAAVTACAAAATQRYLKARAKKLSLKASVVLAAMAVLSACGGGSEVQTAVSLAPASKFGLVVYAGDDLAYLGCSADYNAPYPNFETDTPNAECSAVQGETSAQTLKRFSAVLDQRPAVVVILTGLNDIREAFTGAPTTAAIVEMVQEAQAQGAIVVLCTLPTSADFNAEIQTWNAEIRRIAQTYSTQLADIYAAMANPAAVLSVVEFNAWLQGAQLMDDEGIYPSSAGYLLIWDTALCDALDGDGVVAS